MGRDDTCKIICESDCPFKSYDQKTKNAPYMSEERFRVKILVASDRESDCVIHLGVVTPPVQVKTVHV